MKIKYEILEGKKRMIIIRYASGIDKAKEAVLKVMGNEYEYMDSTKVTTCRG